VRWNCRRFLWTFRALDLGGEVRAVGLELVETENREPVRGKDAAEIWSAVFPALAGDIYLVDFSVTSSA